MIKESCNLSGQEHILFGLQRESEYIKFKKKIVYLETN